MQYLRKKKECLALNTSCYVRRICVVSLVIGTFNVGDLLIKRANQRWTSCGVSYSGLDDIRYRYEVTCFLASYRNNPQCKISRGLVQERYVKNSGQIPKEDCILEACSLLAARCQALSGPITAVESCRQTSAPAYQEPLLYYFYHGNSFSVCSTSFLARNSFSGLVSAGRCYTNDGASNNWKAISCQQLTTRCKRFFYSVRIESEWPGTLVKIASHSCSENADGPPRFRVAHCTD